MNFMVPRFNEGLENPLEIRIGFSSETATIGNFGAADRLSDTFIGGQVNIASRLETLCEPANILISHQTWDFLKTGIWVLHSHQYRVISIFLT
ncbi:MAG: hypothetical protein HQ517_05305 [SAR324 cluster bacterium]|nr:hypothetical protein [SAR324 cluster bacterium]